LPPKQKPPKCFVSYSADGVVHEKWVLKLATRVREKGVDVVLDQWDLEYGNDLPLFMETNVRESDFVVIVCTPPYAKKANASSGGAGYEKQIVTGEMFHGAKASKFIPLVRSGSDDEALPSYLKSRKYVDFRDDTKFDEKLDDLLHQLHGVPKNPRPPIGQFPFSTTGQSKQPDSPKTMTMPDLPPPRSQVEQHHISGPTIGVGSALDIHIHQTSQLPPPLDMALTPPPTKHNAETVTYCQRCGIFPGGLQSECTGLSSSHSFMTRTGVIYCSCCGQRAGVRSVCKRPIGTSHSFVAGDGSEYCQRCGVGLGANVTGCVGLQTCHEFVKREFTNVVRSEDNTFRATPKHTTEMRRLLQGILGLIRPLDENFSLMTLTTVVQPLRDRLVEFFEILEIAPLLNPMSPFLLHDLNQLSVVVGTKKNGVSEVATKMFLNPKTQSLVSKLQTELEEGLRKHS
jgi:hypothetical protein